MSRQTHLASGQRDEATKRFHCEKTSQVFRGALGPSCATMRKTRNGLSSQTISVALISDLSRWQDWRGTTSQPSASLGPLAVDRGESIFFTDVNSVRWRVFDVSFGPPEGEPYEQSTSRRRTGRRKRVSSLPRMATDALQIQRPTRTRRDRATGTHAVSDWRAVSVRLISAGHPRGRE
jgi:hypothetical protein